MVIICTCHRKGVRIPLYPVPHQSLYMSVVPITMHNAVSEHLPCDLHMMDE